MTSVFGTVRSVNLMRDLFMSEHLWVNLSSRNMLYQLSYLMLVERSIDANLIVYVDLIVNQAEYQYEVWTSKKVWKFVYARILSCIPMSSTLYCYVNAKKSYWIKGRLSLTLVKELVKVWENKNIMPVNI